MVGLIDSLKTTFPVVATIVMVWLFTLAPTAQQAQPIITPIPETVGSVDEAFLDPAPYINALIVVGVMAVGGVVFVFLMRRPFVLKVLGSVLITIISFSTTTYNLLFLTQMPVWTIFTVAALVTSWVLISVLKIGGWLSALASAYVGSSAGVVLGESLPFWTAIVLILAVSGYDLLAVSFGHLKALSSFDVGPIPGFMVDYGGMSIGMGDLFFYSIAQSFSLSRFGIIPGLFASLGIFIGFIATAQLAYRRKIVAGLPIPLTLSLALAYLATLLPQ